jgi:hypothetical protein
VLKNPRHNKMLGLALGERSLVAAEVFFARGRAELSRGGEFVYPEGVTLQQPEALGKALAQFLRQEGFSARDAVFGIPARWVLSKAKEAPAAGPDVVADTLRLQAESDFSPELKDLVYDYAGATSAGHPSTVLVMAMPRRHVDQAEAVAKAARLSAVAVMPTAAALAAVSAGGSGSEAAPMVLSLGRGGAEFTAHCGGSPCVLRHLGAATPARVLAAELRRAVSLVPRRTAGSPTNGVASNGNGHADAGAAGGSAGGITLWEGPGVDPATRAALSEALGLPVRSGDLQAIGVLLPQPSQPSAAGGYGAAAALAVAGMAEDGPPVDFLRPKLAPPKKPGIQRRTILYAAVAAVLLLGAVLAYVDLSRREGQLAATEKAIKENVNGVKAAQGFVDKVTFAQGWHGGNPKFLACFRDLTNAMPEDGQSFVTHVRFDDEVQAQGAARAPGIPVAQGAAAQKAAAVVKKTRVIRVTLDGKTSSDRDVDIIRDRLQKQPRFKNVTVSADARDARSGREVSFKANFTYLPEE